MLSKTLLMDVAGAAFNDGYSVLVYANGTLVAHAHSEATIADILQVRDTGVVRFGILKQGIVSKGALQVDLELDPDEDDNLWRTIRGVAVDYVNVMWWRR